MKFDDLKFDQAVTWAQDGLSSLLERGELNGYELGEVLVVSAFKPEDGQGGTLVCIDGSTQIPYVQAGILYLALNTITTGES